MNTTYHEGELMAQELAGERSVAQRNGIMVNDRIIPGAVNFIEKLPFNIVTSVNENGTLAVSVVAGRSGFVKVMDDRTIHIHKNLVTSNPSDIFWKNIENTSAIGILFIEPQTRRRYRLNGSITWGDELLEVHVKQAYPNCPKYVQQRSIVWNDAQTYNEHTEHGSSFAGIREYIVKADTVFVGSSDARSNLDASHRGGQPGFIVVQDDKTLLIPDYAGNSMFNTLGNLLQNTNVALLFADFENNKQLQISGTAKVHWNTPPPELNTGGTGRYWEITLGQWTMQENFKGMSSTFISYSNFNPV